MDRVTRGEDGGAPDFFEGYAADFDHVYDDAGVERLAASVNPRRTASSTSDASTTCASTSSSHSA
jgi:hypothetical protein